MSEELTEKEKRYLSMLFVIGNNFIEHTLEDNTSVLSFTANDLYYLAEKLGIDY